MWTLKIELYKQAKQKGNKKQHYVEMLAPPTVSEWNSDVVNANLTTVTVRQTSSSKTHDIITTLCVENVCVEVHMHVTLWSYPLNEVIQRRDTIHLITRHWTVHMMLKLLL